MNKKILALSTTTFFLLPMLAFAQTIQGITQNLVDTATTLISIIAGGFIIIMFVMAGFKYLTAQGDTSKVSEANKAVIWGLAGVAVIVLAWSVKLLVCNQLGVICF